MEVGHSRVPVMTSEPLKLLEPRDIEEPLLFRAYSQIVFPIGLGFSSVAACYILKRPIRSGLPIHLSAAAVGYFYGQYHEKKYHERNALRDACLRDYVRLHPEDFQPEPVKKYAEVLEPWKPIR